MENALDRVFGHRYTPAAILVLLILLSLFVASKTLAELKNYQYIGGGVPSSNTVSVAGTGEVFAVPDIATFSVTVNEQKATVAEAQSNAADKINAIIEYLKKQGVEEKDIKTENYSVNPVYEYQQITCSPSYCPPGKQTLKGYEANQMLAVKVRDTKKAGTLLSGVGEFGATNVSGLTFTIDDETALQAEARKKAIDDAKTKADALARDLGVHIVRIVSFSESGGPYPIYYDKAVALEASGRGGGTAPSIPTGENKITSNVTITYEIR